MNVFIIIKSDKERVYKGFLSFGMLNKVYMCVYIWKIDNLEGYKWGYLNFIKC